MTELEMFQRKNEGEKKKRDAIIMQKNKIMS